MKFSTRVWSFCTWVCIYVPGYAFMYLGMHLFT
jgi:hypothetical protein